MTGEISSSIEYQDHQVLIDSGFGRYLHGTRPKAIANEFLYYQPSLLLWADSLLCDVHALEAELRWADEGYLVSDVTVRLQQTGIIVADDYERFFDASVQSGLRRLIVEDTKEAGGLADEGYTAPELDNVHSVIETGIENVNALLHVSTVLGVPYVNTQPAERFYKWKFARLAASYFGKYQQEQQLLSILLSLNLPSFGLFPNNELFEAAEDAKQEFLLVNSAAAHGQASRDTVASAYRDSLAAWVLYDRNVKAEVVDNLQVILEMREDRRITSLRRRLSTLAREISGVQSSDSAALRLLCHKEILETQLAITDDLAPDSLLDRCASYISFPVEAASAIAGAVVANITANPLFIAAGLAPSGIRYALDLQVAKAKRAFAWHFYLMHYKEKLSKQAALRALERELETLGRTE